MRKFKGFVAGWKLLDKSRQDPLEMNKLKYEGKNNQTNHRENKPYVWRTVHKLTIRNIPCRFSHPKPTMKKVSGKNWVSNVIISLLYRIISLWCGIHVDTMPQRQATKIRHKLSFFIHYILTNAEFSCPTNPGLQAVFFPSPLATTHWDISLAKSMKTTLI